MNESISLGEEIVIASPDNMKNYDTMLAISTEIWYLLHKDDNEVVDPYDPIEFDPNDEKLFNHWDDEGRKLGYEPAIDIDDYPFPDVNWRDKTGKVYKFKKEDLEQDQRFRGTVNETEHNFTIDDIKQLERLNGLEDVKRQAMSLVSTASKRPISPEKQAWLKQEINGKKDKMAVIKLMYDLLLGGEGMKVIGSKSKYRRRFDEVATTWKNISDLSEAEYHGREVKLGKPMSGDVKKYKVYVKDPKTGNVKKVNFGDKGMEIKRDNPDRRRNFRKRHGCGTPRASDRTKAAYWSCRMWSSKPVSKILKGK